MNTITITGNLGADPEVRMGKTGTAYCKFSVAVKRRFKKDETDWFNVTAFGQTCDFIGKYAQKGTKVCLRGSMQCDKVPSNGETKYYWNLVCDEFEILSGVGSDQKGPAARAPSGGENYSTGNYEGPLEDVPF